MVGVQVGRVTHLVRGIHDFNLVAFFFFGKIRKLDQTREGVTGRKSGKSGKRGINSRTAVNFFVGQVVNGARNGQHSNWKAKRGKARGEQIR